MVAKGVGDNGVIGHNGNDGIFRNRREKELSFWAAPEGIGGRACGDWRKRLWGLTEPVARLKQTVPLDWLTPS